ncbi:MAG: filamentation induced by cAMP protein fic [Thermoplasmata archaeon]
MIFEYKYKNFPKNYTPTSIPLILQKMKHMLPEYIYDTAQLENNPITIPEIKTLIDGITIGGRKISDVQQILNIKDAWLLLMDSLKNGTFSVNMDFSNMLHSKLGREEALEWGVFRTGNISIAGASAYKCPDCTELVSIYNNELSWVMNSDNPVETSLKYFLWGCLNKFYWDCNKRVSRLMAIGILVSNGFGIFNIPAKHVPSFNSLMTSFYGTQKADEVIEFLVNTSIKRIELKKDYYLGSF